MGHREARDNEFICSLLCKEERNNCTTEKQIKHEIITQFFFHLNGVNTV